MINESLNIKETINKICKNKLQSKKLIKLAELIDLDTNEKYSHQVKECIKQYADIDVRDINGTTLLMTIAWSGYLQTAKFLIENGANINAKDNNGYTPLMWGAFSFKENLKTIQLLIDNDADINAQNKYGNTALHIAIDENEIETAKLLIKNNANINLKNNMGNTALDLAIIYECNPIIDILNK